MLVIPTVADPPLKRNLKKGLSTQFHDRTFALMSIASMSGCCQVSQFAVQLSGFDYLCFCGNWFLLLYFLFLKNGI